MSAKLPSRSSTRQTKQICRIGAHEFYQIKQAHTALMNQYSAGCCKAGFQSNDAVWCFEEVCFFLCRMWCMVGHNCIDGSIQNTFTIRKVAWVTGSDVSPPAGDTAPITDRAPSLPSLPREITLPARS